MRLTNIETTGEDSINVRYQVSHPYKTRGKILVLCILMLKT